MSATTSTAPAAPVAEAAKQAKIGWGQRIKNAYTATRKTLGEAKNVLLGDVKQEAAMVKDTLIGSTAAGGKAAGKASMGIMRMMARPLSTAKAFGKWGAIAGVVGGTAYMLSGSGSKPKVNPDLDLNNSAFTAPLDTQPMNFTPQYAAPEPTLMGQPLVMNGPMGSRILQERGGMQTQGFAGPPPLDLHAEDVTLNPANFTPAR